MEVQNRSFVVCLCVHLLHCACVEASVQPLHPLPGCRRGTVWACQHCASSHKLFLQNVLKICVFGIHQLIKSFFFSFLPPSLFILKLTNLPSFTQDVSHEFFMTRRAAHKNVVVALEQ